MLTAVRPNIATLVPYSPGKPVEELQRELGLDHVVKLASNENPLGPSPFAVDALRRRAVDVHAYPDSSAFQLRQRLAAHLGVEADEVLVTNGTNEAIQVVVHSFADDGAHAVFSNHTFTAYRILCEAFGVAYDEVPTLDLAPDLDAMAAAVRPTTRFVFLANPNNPTGMYVSRSQLVSFLDAIPRHVLVVLDEAYFEYVDGSDYPDGLSLRTQYANLVVMRTFSKVYGLAGLRIGYAVMRRELVSIANRVRLPFNTNLLGQAAALAALDDTAFVERSVTHNRQGLVRLRQGLDALGLVVQDSVANFVLVELPQSGRRIFEALLPHGVIVRPMEAYGLPRHLRVSVGLASEIDAFLAALGAVLEKLQ